MRFSLQIKILVISACSRDNVDTMCVCEAGGELLRNQQQLFHSLLTTHKHFRVIVRDFEIYGRVIDWGLTALSAQ